MSPRAKSSKPLDIKHAIVRVMRPHGWHMHCLRSLLMQRHPSQHDILSEIERLRAHSWFGDQHDLLDMLADYVRAGEMQAAIALADEIAFVRSPGRVEATYWQIMKKEGSRGL